MKKLKEISRQLKALCPVGRITLPLRKEDDSDYMNRMGKCFYDTSFLFIIGEKLDWEDLPEPIRQYYMNKAKELYEEQSGLI